MRHHTGLACQCLLLPYFQVYLVSPLVLQLLGTTGPLLATFLSSCVLALQTCQVLCRRASSQAR